MTQGPTAEGQILMLDVLGRARRVTLPLAGTFQAFNALAALGLAVATGISPEAALEALVDSLRRRDELSKGMGKTVAALQDEPPNADRRPGLNAKLAELQRGMSDAQNNIVLPIFGNFRAIRSARKSRMSGCVITFRLKMSENSLAHCFSEQFPRLKLPLGISCSTIRVNKRLGRSK